MVSVSPPWDAKWLVHRLLPAAALPLALIISVLEFVVVWSNGNALKVPRPDYILPTSRPNQSS